MRYVKPHYWDDPDYYVQDTDYTEEELEWIQQAHEDWEVEQALDKLNDKEY
jgi:hypothetical protein